MHLHDLAQVNIARMKGPLESEVMREMVERLRDINELADRSEGFVWRLQSEEGDATYFQPYDDDRILFNMSVWKSLETLKAYVYRTAHAEVMRRRAEWLDKFERPRMALWWVPSDHRPTIEEAKLRLEHLDKHGPTIEAFTFSRVFELVATDSPPSARGAATV